MVRLSSSEGGSGSGGISGAFSSDSEATVSATSMVDVDTCSTIECVLNTCGEELDCNVSVAKALRPCLCVTARGRALLLLIDEAGIHAVA